MKSRYLLMASCSLVLASAAYAVELPGTVRGAAASRATSSANARLPRVNADAASQTRARAALRTPRVRAGANADLRGAASLNRNRIDASGSANTTARARVGGDRSPEPQRDDAARDDRRPSGARAEHQARTHFISRMAQIEHMRDVAVETGNIGLLKRADQLEGHLHHEMRQFAVQWNARVWASQRLDANSDSFRADGQAEGEAAGRVSRRPRRDNPQTDGDQGDVRPETQPDTGADSRQPTARGADATGR